MHVDFSNAWITAVLLCALRLSALLLLAPFWQPLGLPVRVRLMIILAFSATLVSATHATSPVLLNSLPALIQAAMTELLVGALMAFGVFTAFAAIAFAGNALDLQIGFNIANVFDPVTRSQSPLLASIFAMTAVMLFFSADAHHTVIRGFAWSLERIPLGGPAPRPDIAALGRQFGIVFTLGLTLAAPVMFCLFLVELAMAVLSRNLQQLNVFVLGTPIKIILGLMLLATLAPQFGHTTRRIFDAIFTFWQAVL
ncbi:flagellar biosynthetic protein FliR [Massilia sp. S19_KUP03_FR1]|uniref:flagellar biosynthetic protein FliR n=1 Tax=Massilia sp. S19_KUP03_FR1 TaxID=3025503 RepID=UPI002FCDC5A1